MVRMNFIFIFIPSSDTSLLRKKSVKQKIKKPWPKLIRSVNRFTGKFILPNNSQSDQLLGIGELLQVLRLRCLKK